MNYRVWYSTESFADYIIDNTTLRDKCVVKKKIYESDANNPTNFHTMPDHIKKILYLDAPDIIVELNSEPIFSIEISTEAGTGHNAFQRFARLAASVENSVPAFYIYPEATIITRQDGVPKWDKINPLVFKALTDMMAIYNIPALLYYFPSDFKEYHARPDKSPNKSSKGLKLSPKIKYAGSPVATDPEMISLFLAINEMLEVVIKEGVISGRTKLLSKRAIIKRRDNMLKEYVAKSGNENMSPLTATCKIPTSYLLNFLSCYESNEYKLGELIRSRAETIVYKINAKFRGDPYPGALAAIDYLLCREGKSFEERKYNLVLAWGSLNIDHQNRTIALVGKENNVNHFIDDVRASENRNLLTRDYSEISNSEIPRYYMQVRYGSTFSKAKHVRVYSYFADAILFPNGSLWRDS